MRTKMEEEEAGVRRWMEKARGKELKSRRSQVQRDSRLAGCDYITVTKEEKQGGGLCGGVERHLERCEMGAPLG